MRIKPQRRLPPIANVRLNCPFCSKRISSPKLVQTHADSGVLGGQCACGAFFALDNVEKPGGFGLFEATFLACDGDGERAKALEMGVHYELRTLPLGRPKRQGRGPVSLPIVGPSAGGGGGAGVGSKQEPKAWFVLLKEP